MTLHWGRALAIISCVTASITGCQERSTSLQSSEGSNFEVGSIGVRTGEIALTSSTGRHFGFYASAMWPENHINALVNRSSFVFIHGADYLPKIVQAKALGLKAILSVQPFFFDGNAHVRPDFQQQWEVARQAIAPYRDTILAFYTLDEPYLNGAIYGIPVNKTLENLELVAKTVKSSFPGIPLAMTEAYSHVTNQLALPPSYDWFGFDCYSGFEACGDNLPGIGVRSIPQMLSILKSKVQALNQADGRSRGLVLLPPSAYHTKSGVTEAQLLEIADKYIQLIKSEPMVVAVMPFLWHTFSEGNGQWIGLRDLGPALKNKYLEMAAETLGVSNSAPAPCATPSFSGGNLSTRAAAPSEKFILSCDYGNTSAKIYPVVPSGSCSFTQFSGTAAQFSCTAPSSPGSYSVSCQISANTASNTCARTDSLGALNIMAPAPKPCVTPTFLGANWSSRTVAPGESFPLSCNYGKTSNLIYPVVSSGNCVFDRFTGTDAQFRCTAPKTVGDHAVFCQISADPASNSCARGDSLGNLNVKTPASKPTETTPACNMPSFRSGALSSAAVIAGGEVEVSCDYGRISSLISPTGALSCQFTSFVGTAAKFKCAAPTAPGAYPISCMLGADSSSRTCARVDLITSLNVQARPSCTQAPWLGGTISSNSVPNGGSFSLSCNYGMQSNAIYPSASGANCVFGGFAGTEARFNCTAPTGVKSIEVGCSFGGNASQSLCSRNDKLGVIQLR